MAQSCNRQTVHDIDRPEVREGSRFHASVRGIFACRTRAGAFPRVLRPAEGAKYPGIGLMSFGSGACSAIKGALPSRGRPYAIFALLFGAACLLALGVETAQAPAAPPLGSMPLADDEPITAIPPPTAADPLKLALGEQLFGDR